MKETLTERFAFPIVAIGTITILVCGFHLGQLTAQARAATLDALPVAQEPGDDFDEVSRISRWVDPETGCQYISAGARSPWTLRVHSDGVPFCDDREEQAALDDQLGAREQITPYIPAIDGPEEEPATLVAKWVM